jgi:predicted nucleic acid-binding protein
MIPAFFRETLMVGGNPFDISARARPIAEAIRLGTVTAFAPDALPIEFLEVAHRKAKPRNAVATITAQEFENQFVRFMSLPITGVAAAELAAISLDLCNNAEISPADSWYVACAMLADAELWISHDHADGLVNKARAVHDRIYTLTTRRFESKD